MAHTAPPTPTKRRLELAFGLLLLAVGVSIAIVAVLALNHPAGQQAAGASETGRSAGGTSALVSTPASSSTPPSNSASSTPGTSSDPASSGSASTQGGSSSTAGSGKLPLVVLNNTSDIPGSVAADRFRQAGWTVTDVSTFTGAILSTAAYYDPDVAGADAAASELQRQFPAIHRVKPKFQGLPEGPIVIVLTSDYS